MTPRLTTEFWVAAYLRRLQAEGIAVYVTARGDPTAGGLVIKLARLDGTAEIHERGFDLASGARLWRRAMEGAEPEIDAALGRMRGRDPDLWVIEVEDRQGRTLLDTPGLSG